MEATDLRRELELLHADSFGWALSCCRQRKDDAEEVLQTAYIKVLDGRAKFEGRSSFRTWFFGVIRRTASEQQPAAVVARHVAHALVCRAAFAIERVGSPTRNGRGQQPAA
jgi:DNA-directed RNA polymerase specialized sigma24 family protein